MKKTSNKGFSMVELIIVIAIMAILAAALAPSLIKYINKSRLSTDVTTGTTIATSINSALAVEKAYDSATQFDNTTTALDDILHLAPSNSFAKEVCGVLGVATDGNASVKGKSKKDIEGDNFSTQSFYVLIDQKNNKVSVWYGTASDDYLVSPSVGAKMAE